MTHPRVRTTGLTATAVAGDLVVYDEERRTSHALNGSAALVFRYADGTRSEADLVVLLQAELNAAADADLLLVALAQLERARLLEGDGAYALRAAREARRRFVRKVGLVGTLSLLLPVVESVVAPRSAMAASVPAGCDSSSDSGCNTNSASASNSSSGCNSLSSSGCASNSGSASNSLGGNCGCNSSSTSNSSSACNSLSYGPCNCNSNSNSNSDSLFCASS